MATDGAKGRSRIDGRRDLNDARSRYQRSIDGRGGGPHDGDMEARVAKLEATAEYMREDIRDIKADLRAVRDNARTDFRLLFGALITVALGLAALMAHGFKWL